MNKAIALSLLVFMATACSAGSILSPSSTILYQITGTAKHVSITYQSSTGGTSQTGSALPFSYAYGSAKKGDFLYISAQIDTSPDAGNITVTILKNGTTLFSGTANGFPNIATANGSLP